MGLFEAFSKSSLSSQDTNDSGATRIGIDQIGDIAASTLRAFLVTLKGQVDNKAPSSRGLPSGGSTGQTLTKNSNTDYDVEWSAGSGGGGGAPSGPAGGVLSGTYPDPGFASDMATQAELDAHVGAADPHTVYQKESEKDQNSGYVGKDANGLVTAQTFRANNANTNKVTIGSVSTFEAFPGVWFGSTTPDITNYSFLYDSAQGTILNAPASRSIFLRIANSSKATLSATLLTLASGVGLAIGGGTTITRHLSGTATWDPGSVAAGAQTSTTVTVTNAALGDTVAVGFSQDLQLMQLTGYVSGANTVTVVLRNGTAGAIDLASGTLRADVWQH